MPTPVRSAFSVEGEGPALFLIHGIGASRASFAGLLPHLNPGVMDEDWLARLRKVAGEVVKRGQRVRRIAREVATPEDAAFRVLARIPASRSSITAAETVPNACTRPIACCTCTSRRRGSSWTAAGRSP